MVFLWTTIGETPIMTRWIVPTFHHFILSRVYSNDKKPTEHFRVSVKFVPTQLLHPVTTFKCGVYYKHLVSVDIEFANIDWFINNRVISRPIWTPLIILLVYWTLKSNQTFQSIMEQYKTLSYNNLHYWLSYKTSLHKKIVLGLINVRLLY